jgi:hypothetical protein
MVTTEAAGSTRVGGVPDPELPDPELPDPELPDPER